MNGTDFGAGGVVTLPYNGSQTFTLPAGEGPRTVSVRFVDRAGNVSAAASATVAVDTVRPALGPTPLRILGGDLARPLYTRTPVVSLALDATDANGGPSGASLYVRISNAAGLPGALFQPYAPTLSWVLSPGDGPKTVYAQFMDAAGNVSDVAAASITLDAAGPGAPSLSIEEHDARPGNGQTNVATVTLVLSASGAPALALVSEDPGFASAETVLLAGEVLPYRTTHVLSGLGSRTLYARFVDDARNTSDVVQAAVTLDQPPPLAVAPVVAPTPWTRSAAIALTPPAAGQDELSVSGAGVVATGYVSAPAGVAIPVSLSGGDGTKTFAVTYRDAAENTTTVGGLSVALDATAPAAGPFAIRGALADGSTSTSLTAARTVTLDLSGVSDPASGVAEMPSPNPPPSPGPPGSPWRRRPVHPLRRRRDEDRVREVPRRRGELHHRSGPGAD